MCVLFGHLGIQKPQRKSKSRVQCVKGGVEHGKTGSKTATVTAGLGRET